MWQSQEYLWYFSVLLLGRWKSLGDQTGSTTLLKKDSAKVEESLIFIYLKDVPLEDRRKEAEKPLFLTRYE
jgi:hypothetical protein